MPIYEYCCEHCDEHSEVLQGIHDAPLLQCTACGQNSLKRVLSTSGFRLKGAGWYETDFKTPGDKQKNLVNDTSQPTKTQNKVTGHKPSTTE